MVSIRLSLAEADLRCVVSILLLVGLVAGRGGLNAGRPRLATGLDVGAIDFKKMRYFGHRQESRMIELN